MMDCDRISGLSLTRIHRRRVRSVTQIVDTQIINGIYITVKIKEQEQEQDKCYNDKHQDYYIIFR